MANTLIIQKQKGKKATQQKNGQKKKKRIGNLVRKDMI